jgi:hypothetical protein
MRLLVTLAVFLAPLAAFADEIDLSQTSSRRASNLPPEFILRAEGGSTFAPYGYAGAALSWMVASGLEFEGGMGAGFPGLQLGLSVRTLFDIGDPGQGQFLLGELSLAGNTRVNRAQDQQQTGPTFTNNSLWTCIGFGGELRHDFYSFDLVGSLVLTTQSLTPHFSVHGGFGFGF